MVWDEIEAIKAEEWKALWSLRANRSAWTTEMTDKQNRLALCHSCAHLTEAESREQNWEQKNDREGWREGGRTMHMGN